MTWLSLLEQCTTLPIETLLENDLMVAYFKQTKCAYVPGSTVRDMIHKCLLDPSISPERRWTVFSLAVANKLHSDPVRVFVQSVVVKEPEKTWEHVLHNVYLLNFLDQQTLKTFLKKSHHQDLLDTIYYSMSVCDMNSLYLKPSVVDELLEHCISIYNSKHENDRIRESVISTVRVLLHCLESFSVINVDSPVVRIFKVVSRSLCKVNTFRVFRSGVEVICLIAKQAVCDGRSRIFDTLVKYMYDVILHCSYQLPPRFFRYMYCLDKTFKHLPYLALIDVIERRGNQSDNVFSVLHKVCQDPDWSSWICSNVDWSILLGFSLERTYAYKFFSEFAVHIDGLIPGCRHLFTECKNVDALDILHITPYNVHNYDDPVFSTCESVIFDSTIAYEHKVNASVLLTGTLIREQEQSKTTASVIFVRTFTRLCQSVSGFGLLVIFIRGLSMITNTDLHKQCLPSLRQAVEKNCNDVVTFKHAVQQYATTYPQLFFAYVMDPLVRDQNINAVGQICPKLRSRGKIWTSATSKLLKLVLLESRLMNSCAPVYKLFKCFENVSSKYKWLLFKFVVLHNSELVKSLHSLPVSFNLFVDFVHTLEPDRKTLQAHPDFVNQIAQNAYTLKTSHPSFSSLLLWSVRKVLREFWVCDFCKSQLQYVPLSLTIQRLKDVVTIYIWNTHLENKSFDSVVADTALSQHLRVRFATYEICETLPKVVQRKFSSSVSSTILKDPSSVIHLRPLLNLVKYPALTKKMVYRLTHIFDTCPHHQLNVLHFICDAFFIGVRVKSTTALEHVASWTVEWIKKSNTLDPSTHTWLVDICSQVTNYLYKQAVKQAHTEIRTFKEMTCLQDVPVFKHLRTSKPRPSVSRLVQLMPEVNDTITSFLSLPDLEVAFRN